MSAQDNKDLIHEVIEVIFNNFELDRLEEFFTEDFQNHDGPPGGPVGPAAFRAYLPMMKQAFPDRKLTPEFTLCDGDRVVSRTITEGHMTGSL
ncbi:MAG: ester cyclase, partial [Gammaproteobacteria bacterium]|nr:ester cyclase [Gammaproteobacteria bacterium]